MPTAKELGLNTGSFVRLGDYDGYSGEGPYGKLDIRGPLAMVLELGPPVRVKVLEAYRSTDGKEVPTHEAELSEDYPGFIKIDTGL